MTTLTKIATDVARKPIQRATAQQPFTFFRRLTTLMQSKNPSQNQPIQPMNSPKNITGISIIVVTIDWVFTAYSPMSFSRKWHAYVGTFGRQEMTVLEKQLPPKRQKKKKKCHANCLCCTQLSIQSYSLQGYNISNFGWGRPKLYGWKVYWFALFF